MDKLEAYTLHSMVAKILWVAKWGRPEIESTILLLRTRVTKITVKDKEKMNCVLQLLKQTIDNKRIMWEDKLIQLFTWFDAAYVTHPNIKIHTGGGMPFSYGHVHCKFIKQQLNTKSSTEDEVVGVRD